jgi:hypothetical protein
MFGQASVNPDISVIPRFLVTSNDGEKLGSGIREFTRPDFQFQELELQVESYLNPFAKGYVILTVPGPDIENGKLGIEELYASVFRGLPLDLNLRAGKYRAEFGKLNTMHPHAWPFISEPLVAKRFLGEEGLNDLGASVSTILPTGDVFSKLTVDVLRGNSISSAAGISDTTGAKPNYALSSRLMAFFSIGDESDLETGVSVLTGIHNPYTNDRFWYVNADAKFKWRPSAYTSLVLQGEYLFNTRNISSSATLIPFVDGFIPASPSRLNSGGAYFYADYQFFKLYSAGFRLDWAESPYSVDDKAKGFAVFAGYYPVEETLGLRFEWMHVRNESPIGRSDVNTLGLQMLFSLGPHKAHPF